MNGEAQLDTSWIIFARGRGGCRLALASGAQVRSIRLDPILSLETAEVGALIDVAVACARPLPASGAGKLVIKSISAKRLRRPA